MNLFNHYSSDMNPHCTVQIYTDMQWQDIAIVELLGASSQGWQAATCTDYLLDYALDALERTDAAALSWALAVNVDRNHYSTWPPFLLDILPQGFGRQELLKYLGYAESAEKSGDWDLLLTGAGNPIGHLRIKEAYEWLQQQKPDFIRQGFTQADIAQRSETFIEGLAAYGMFVSGSSGVQGEWPKLLLTEAHDGLFYLDHQLPDALAKQHWLVKFSRGADTQLAKIFQHEAIYMRLAKFLGLRVHADLQLIDRALFIPRFDRSITTQGVQRHAQESIAVLCNKAGFGVRLSHNEICQTLAAACTDPLTEIIEYLKRDIANVALGNKDNHARNTAIQRDWLGQITLTPLFDFAPMWLHPQGIARVTRWQYDDEGGSPRWASVLAQIATATGLNVDPIKQALIDWLPRLEQLEQKMHLEHIDAELIDNSHFRLHTICTQLKAL